MRTSEEQIDDILADEDREKINLYHLTRRETKTKIINFIKEDIQKMKDFSEMMGNDRKITRPYTQMMEQIIKNIRKI